MAENDIQITPEMISTGLKVWADWEDSDDGDVRKFLKELYLSMRLIEPRSAQQYAEQQSANA